ncbi:MAG TPA: EAL domain-containing protein [Caulobacteraceae bacterium]|nr:EAL domain-containing protein [Caulobacteraceae bacterium]
MLTAVSSRPNRAMVLGLAAFAAAGPLAMVLALIAAGPPGGDWMGGLLFCLALGAPVIAIVAINHLFKPAGADAGTAGGGASVRPPRERRAARAAGSGRAVAPPEAGERADRHPVTGLPAREAFLEWLAGVLEARPEGAIVGVIRFSDHDRLAAFDQTAADRALAAFAGRLGRLVSPSRHLAHIDRDCFAVWFGDTIDAKAVASEMHAVGYILAQELRSDEVEVNPEVELAAAIWPRDGATAPALLASAVAALQLTRRGDSPELSFASHRSAAEARKRFTLEQDLHHAIVGDQFLLHFQPVVDLDAGRVVGAEALLRWRRPEIGMMPPGAFISVLEDSSMMDEVGLWVLNAACREVRMLNDLGLRGMKMAVNVSGRQLRDGRLPAIIERTLKRHALEAAQLEIELTETAALEDENRTRDLLTDLRGLGVSVAIDDFGTGHSSLSKLKRLPFSKLKIDREFVTGVDVDSDNQAICGSLVELARGLGMTILAEGAETLAEVETVRRLGCAMFQGYFFARPLPAAEFERTVADPEWLAMSCSPARREQAKLYREVAAA